MKFGFLKDIFACYASKQVTAVEVDQTASNGHEFNSSQILREILGTTTRKCKDGNGIETRFFYFSDNEDDEVEAKACLSWYDARANHKTRTEWRLYYTDNEVIGREGRARTGDGLIIAFDSELKNASVLVAAAGSTIESQLRWLFGIDVEQTLKFSTASVASSAIVDASRARILEAIGIVLPVQDDNLLERILERFGKNFPRASVFSDFVRAEVPEIRVENGIDMALLTWMEREEFTFRVLERYIVGERLKIGFENVDDFVACSLSVQNRRKARAGRAFENHLGAVFSACGVVFARGAQVENKARPDFLFPGVTQYLDEAFPVALLTLLGAKTSCKDRWRQVLAEGKRLKQKFLVTLEPAISGNQLAEMRDASLQLVVPSGLHNTYTLSEQGGILSVEAFVSTVLERQKKAGIQPISKASFPNRDVRKKR